MGRKQAVICVLKSPERHATHESTARFQWFAHTFPQSCCIEAHLWRSLWWCQEDRMWIRISIVCQQTAPAPGCSLHTSTSSIPSPQGYDSSKYRSNLMDALAPRQASVQTRRHQGLSNRLLVSMPREDQAHNLLRNVTARWNYTCAFFYQVHVFPSTYICICTGVAPDTITLAFPKAFHTTEIKKTPDIVVGKLSKSLLQYGGQDNIL